MNKFIQALIIAVVLIAGLLTFAEFENQSTLAESTVIPNCRYGLAIEPDDGLPRTQEIDWLPTFGSGWYIDFGTEPASKETPYSAEHVNLIRLSQNKDSNGNRLDAYKYKPSANALRQMVSTHKGQLWLIGNEVDRVHAQDDIFPQLYAKAYHEIYHLIKNADPTAQVANSGLVEVTPGRLQYLDIVWDTYFDLYGQPMPVDVWNAHIYILPERQPNGEPSMMASIALGTDINLGIFQNRGTLVPACENPYDNTYCNAEQDSIPIFQKQIKDMRRWMKEHGQQNKPLIITEYSLLFPYYSENGCVEDEYGNCFTQQRVSNYMMETMDWMSSQKNYSLGFAGDDYKLVQQWLWFSAYSDGVGHASNFLKHNYPSHPAGTSSQMTLVGQTYKDIIASAPSKTDLLIERTFANHDAGVVTLGADIRNAGNIPLVSPVKISFYANSAQTDLIGQVTLNPVLNGCARDVATVTTTWTPPHAGVNQFWVKVDSGNQISEMNEMNNGKSGLVIESPSQVWIPFVHQ